jgi:hypothetical protein
MLSWATTNNESSEIKYDIKWDKQKITQVFYLLWLKKLQKKFT